MAATISRFGLDPSTITLEITETMLMHDTELTQQRLADLRAIGVSLAVDDFGTGYSSLQYIQRFPIDIIKIDRSFVSGLGEQAGDVVVVQSMIELAQASRRPHRGRGHRAARAGDDPAVPRLPISARATTSPVRSRQTSSPHSSPAASPRARASSISEVPRRHRTSPREGGRGP